MNTKLRNCIALAATVLAVAAAAPSKPAEAASVEKVGWAGVYVDVDSLDEPSIDPPSKAWTAGGQFPVPTVKRLARGRYRITVPGLDVSRGMVNLTTIHAASDPVIDPICSLRSVSGGSYGTRFDVNCFDPTTGKMAPGRHFMVFGSTYGALADGGMTDVFSFRTTTSGSTTPSRQYRNEGAGKIKVKRVKRGIYRVTIPATGWDFDDGVMVVSAVSTSARWCNPADGGTEGDLLIAEVRCYRPGGASADSKFSLVATRTTLLNDDSFPGGSQMSYLLGDEDGPEAFDLWGYNTAATNNFGIVVPATGDVNIVFPSVFDADPRVVLVGGSAVARCSRTLPAVFALFRNVVGHCVAPDGTMVRSSFMVIDQSLRDPND